MRSKRSKAWHRRKDEKARAIELIEQGLDRRLTLADILRKYSKSFRFQSPLHVLLAVNRG